MNSLLDKDDDYFNYKITDPSLANGRQSTVVNEVNQIKNTHPNNKLIKRLCDYILKADKQDPIFSSLNYYDLLLKS